MKKKRNVWGIMLLAAVMCGTGARAESEADQEPREYLFEESDRSLLTEEELEGLIPQLIVYGKNEIYARHGMIFESKELAEYFEGQSWYFGFIEEKDFPENMLNETELQNLELLDQWEQEAGEEDYELDQAGYSFEAVTAYLKGEPYKEEEKKTEPEEQTEKKSGIAEPEEAETEETETEETTELETEMKPQTERESGAETEAQIERESEAETEAQTERKPRKETEPQIERKSEVETEPQTERKPEAETEIQTERKTQPEVETERKIEAGPETQTEAKTKPMTEAEAETKAERDDGLELAGNSDEHGVNIFQESAEGALENTASEALPQAVSGASGEQVQSKAPQTMQVAVDTEYIFPEVNSRYLSKNEVNALSLQAICYAKNEVYARHGRKFRSVELQQYFGSKSWYRGTVEPDSFSDKVFNIYESQNVQLLAACEAAIRSDGYQLDQWGYDISLVKTASVMQTVAAPEAQTQGQTSENGVSGAGDGSEISEEEYLSREYIFRDSDIRYLTEEEVGALSAKVACYARYEIFARRGCLFSSNELLQYFSKKSWYAGRVFISDFSQDLLNKFELYNIELLNSRELQAASGGYPLN